MLTTRRPRLRPNSTAPAVSAKRVSSPPRPTLSPGWKWVPRCRTMISPALTLWPPNRFTPSRWELESRPFRLEDAPFLCAMAGLLPSLDAGDPHRGQLRAVTLALVVAGLVLELVQDDLRALGLRDDLGGHGGLGEGLTVGGHLAAVVDEEYGGQLHGLAGSGREPVDLERVADG